MEEKLRPLEDVHVLDLTAFQQGPVGTTLLADLGADVIKIEPIGGELGRRLRVDESGFSAFFEAHNRGKRSLSVDLTRPDGKVLIQDLVKRVDVVVENFRRGTMERLGLGFEALRELNPRVILASASGYGPLGPIATAPAFDASGQALSGLMFGQRLSADAPPVPMLYGIADSVGGLLLANAVLAALHERDRGGAGLTVDISILGSALYVQAVEVVESLRAGYAKPMRRHLTPTFGPYEARDGKWLVIASVSPLDWPRLCTALSRDDWRADPEMSRARWRATNADEAERRLADVFRTRSRDEWIARLSENDLPCSPVLDYVESSMHPQVLANRYVRGVETDYGPAKVVGSPIIFNGLPSEVDRAPRLGEHSIAILQEYGYSANQIDALVTDGTVAVE